MRESQKEKLDAKYNRQVEFLLGYKNLWQITKKNNIPVHLKPECTTSETFLTPTYCNLTIKFYYLKYWGVSLFLLQEPTA